MIKSVAVLATATWLATVSVAAAHSTPAVPQVKTERQLQTFERATLGDAHAAEHAAHRRAERRVTRAWRKLSRATTLKRRIRARAAAAGPDDSVGKWGAPFDVKAFAINTVLLPTGKVLYWSFAYDGYTQAGGFRPEAGVAVIWDPKKGYGDAAFERVDPPTDARTGKPAMIWCSGQSLLADGRVLVTGGGLQQRPVDPKNPNNGGSWAGLNKAFIFDPWKKEWTEQPEMNDGRWYPSQVLLPDASTLILSGYDGNLDPAERINPQLEQFTLDGDGQQGRFKVLPQGERTAELYPHLFVMPSGKVLLAGPGENDSGLLDPNTMLWEDLPKVPGDNRVGGTAVLRSEGPGASTKVTQFGGWEEGQEAKASTVTLDEANPGAGWQADAPLNHGRRYHNTVLLPDGSMVTVGGDDGVDAWTAKAELNRQVELYDPRTQQWTLGESQQERRGYHSTAILLPDGRVLSAGDDSAGGTKADTGEVFSPPYLFKPKARPKVDGAPGRIDYGQEFEVRTATPGPLKAVLMAPGATTHAADMHQRRVELTAEPTDGGVRVDAPESGNIAPPGAYMLFLVNDEGKPSEATWVQLGAASAAPEVPKTKAPEPGNKPAETPPASAPTPPAATPTPTQTPTTTPSPIPTPSPSPIPTPSPSPTPTPSPSPTVGVQVDIVGASLRRTLRRGALQVRTRLTGPATVRLKLRVSVPNRGAATLPEIKVAFPAAGTRTVAVRLTTAARRLLRGAPRAELRVETRGAGPTRTARAFARR